MHTIGKKTFVYALHDIHLSISTPLGRVNAHIYLEFPTTSFYHVFNLKDLAADFIWHRPDILLPYIPCVSPRAYPLHIPTPITTHFETRAIYIRKHTHRKARHYFQSLEE